MRSAFISIVVTAFASAGAARACCAVSAHGVPVVNADQTVILVWDQARQTEHFIRKASFLSDGESVGFLVPTPTRPQLERIGDAAFPYLAQLTAPKKRVEVGLPFSCAASPDARSSTGVRVVEEKDVAGYHAVVLAADSGKSLVAWLADHGYAFTPEAAVWAQPYLEGRWYMTAMKFAKDPSGKTLPRVAASALRITFRTDRPLFPYREPDSRQDASSLHAPNRLLRIHFIGESRYEGRFSSGQAWEGRTRWSQPLNPEQRTRLLSLLRLPGDTGPTGFWLTEFEDDWRYGKAPGDVYFSASADQKKIARSASVTVDPLLVLGIGLFVRRSAWRRKRGRSGRADSGLLADG